MGAFHPGPPRPAGLEARQQLDAFLEARTQVALAKRALGAVLAASDLAPPSDAAFVAGLDLARRRLQRAEARRDALLELLAGDRPSYEVFWRLPDDF